MRQKGISRLISKRLKILEKHFYEIINGFEIESIHEFRTEVKKLRAFLRLLNVETGSRKRLKISKKIKTFYSYAGTIRNLQLQLENVHPYAGDSPYIGMEAYLDYLKKIIEKWEITIKESTGKRNDFNHNKRKIIKKLPGKLRKGSIKKFIQNKMNELATLIEALPGDDVLHSIRKLLKDISYNWTFLKKYSQLLPLAFSEKEKIKSFTELIGLFLDKDIGIILLETYCKDCEENGTFSEKEIKDLQQIKGEWESKKTALARVIYLNPGLLQPLPVS